MMNDDLSSVLMDINISTQIVSQKIKDQLNYFPTEFFDGDFIHSIVFTIPRGLPNLDAKQVANTVKRVEAAHKEVIEGLRRATKIGILMAIALSETFDAALKQAITDALATINKFEELNPE